MRPFQDLIKKIKKKYYKRKLKKKKKISTVQEMFKYLFDFSIEHTHCRTPKLCF